MPRHLSDIEFDRLRVALDRLIPPDPATGAPGAGASGGAIYIDRLLGAFAVDPPLIFAGGPFSGRHGGDDGFSTFLPLGRLEELAWRIRIEGSLGRPEREINGPTIGWQERYCDGLAALGGDFTDVSPLEQDRRLDADPSFKELLYEHACEGLYGDPVYGGNQASAGWTFISFPGDVVPRGWTDGEVHEG